jgi:hypothetical protein
VRLVCLATDCLAKVDIDKLEHDLFCHLKIGMMTLNSNQNNDTNNAKSNAHIG